MATNVGSNDGNDVVMEDGSKRRSSRAIKRKKFDDELVESSMRGESGVSTPKIQRAQSSRSSNVTPAKTVHIVPEIVIENTAPSTSTTEPQKIPSSTKSISSNVSKSFPSVPCVPSTSKASSSVNKNKFKKKKIVKNDFGRWKPTDDLMLIESVMNTNDLQLVHRGVKFSCIFTLKEITRRWEALLYDPKISYPAKSAMNNLHPETVANIESKALFSLAEESLLATIQSRFQPTIETFKKLLTENPNIFHRRRTAIILMHQWQLMKQYSLLSDQCSALENPISTPLSALEDRNIHILNNEQEVTTLTSEHITSLAEYEELFNDEQLLTQHFELEPELEEHFNLINLKMKEEIKILEDELPKAQALVFPVTGMDPEEFDQQTLAVMRGRSVRYLMRSREITIGRSSKFQEVDVDLKVEGPAWKISRRQATIRMRDSGDFVILCEGKRCLYVDGKPLAAGDLGRLNHNSVIEIASLRFIFLINHSLVNTIKLEIVQQNQLQLPDQTVNQTLQNQHAIKSQKTTMTKSEKLAQKKKQHQQNMLAEQERLQLELQKIMQQEQDEELQEQLKLLNVTEAEYNLQQQTM